MQKNIRRICLNKFNNIHNNLKYYCYRCFKNDFSITIEKSNKSTLCNAYSEYITCSCKCKVIVFNPEVNV